MYIQKGASKTTLKVETVYFCKHSLLKQVRALQPRSFSPLPLSPIPRVSLQLQLFSHLELACMDTDQWPQEVGMVKPMEEMVPSSTCSRPPIVERKARPQKDQVLNCPRCNSINTKFCYYNNYSLTQPRYFCKTCRRYWTEGGSLRNVPVGGGSRKNKRSSSSSSSNLSSKKTTLSDLNPPSIPSQKPKINGGQDLNLAFQTPQEYHNMSQLDLVELPNIDNSNNNNNGSSTSSSSNTSLPALELLRTGIASRGLNSFMPMPMTVPDSNSVYPSGFGLNFSFDGTGNGGAYVNNMGGQESGSGRLLFPFEDLKPVSSNDFDQNRGQGNSTTGYWNGMLGGGSW